VGGSAVILAAGGAWALKGSAVGGPWGAVIGGALGTIGGVIWSLKTANQHEKCKEWVDKCRQALLKELGGNMTLGIGSNGGIRRMNYCFFNCNDPDGNDHTMWKVIFKDGTKVYIDSAYHEDRDSFHPGYTLPSEWTIANDYTGDNQKKYGLFSPRLIIRFCSCLFQLSKSLLDEDNGQA
jgi:hypothetical protein